MKMLCVCVCARARARAFVYQACLESLGVHQVLLQYLTLLPSIVSAALVASYLCVYPVCICGVYITCARGVSVCVCVCVFVCRYVRTRVHVYSSYSQKRTLHSVYNL